MPPTFWRRFGVVFTAGTTLAVVSPAIMASQGAQRGHTVAQETTGTSVYWAFRPPAQAEVPLPPVPYAPIQNPIDGFLLSALWRRGITFSPEADKRTLLRRVTFDLIGLPPTSAELEAYLADSSPNAWEKVVDRLLADPRYGEHWARHWLDVAGYADSEGVLEEDRIRPNAWRYRDYVIRSLNGDKPYDRFLREQIAGDELTDYRNAAQWTPQIEAAVTATGFLRTAVDATRDDFNTHQFTEYQYRMLHDTQTILISSTLGVTLQCARCHDHKYEPFSQKDYYRVQALLAGAIRPAGALLPTNRRQIVAATAADQKRVKEGNEQAALAIKELDQKVAVLLAEFRLRALERHLPTLPEGERIPLLQAARLAEAQRSAEQKALLVKHKALLETPPDTLATLFPEFKQAQATLQQAKAEADKKRVTLPEIRALYDQDALPPPTHLLLRGEWTQPGEIVAPGIPTILEDPKHPFKISPAAAGSATTGRRKALAEWITRPNNPLTARVIVNRLWAYHFGVGLVPSVENFGRSGAAPTNQPLLDWLACRFVASDARDTVSSTQNSHPSRLLPEPSFACGWSLKKLHRLLVTSEAYRQSSAYRIQPAHKDPENRLLWRQRARRLEAESLRDSLLAVTNTLDTTMYGEPVNEETRPTGEIVPEGEEKGGRRSLYLLVRRSKPVTLLNTFDAPVMETNCTRRITSTTPTQALALLNSGFMATQAQHFAQRVMKETADGTASVREARSKTESSASKIECAYRLAFGRMPVPQEQTATQKFLLEQTTRYQAAGKSPSAAAEQALTDLCLALLSANEFVYVD